MSTLIHPLVHQNRIISLMESTSQGHNNDDIEFWFTEVEFDAIIVSYHLLNLYISRQPPPTFRSVSIAKYNN